MKTALHQSGTDDFGLPPKRLAMRSIRSAQRRRGRHCGNARTSAKICAQPVTKRSAKKCGRPGPEPRNIFAPPPQPERAPEPARMASGTPVPLVPGPGRVRMRGPRRTIASTGNLASCFQVHPIPPSDFERTTPCTRELHGEAALEARCRRRQPGRTGRHAHGALIKYKEQPTRLLCKSLSAT